MMMMMAGEAFAKCGFVAFGGDPDKKLPKKGHPQ